MDREEFLRGLEAYHLERGHAFTPGRLLGQKVDLYEMFVTAMRQGGFPRINKNNKWGFLAKHLRLVPKDKPPSAQDLEQVKRYYVKWIRHFEGEKVPQHVKKHLIPPGMELPCRRSASSSSSGGAAAATGAHTHAGATTPFHPTGGVVGYHPGATGGGLGILSSVLPGGGSFVPGAVVGGLQPSRAAGGGGASGVYGTTSSSMFLGGGGGNKAAVAAGYMNNSSNAGLLLGPSPGHPAFFIPPGFAAATGAPGFAAAASPMGGPLGGALLPGNSTNSNNSSSILFRPSAGACPFDPTAAYAAAAAVNALGPPMIPSPPHHLSAAGKIIGGAGGGSAAAAHAAAHAVAAVTPCTADELLLANCCIAGARTRNERKFLQQQQQQHQHILTTPGAAASALPSAAVPLSLPLPYSPSVSGTAQPGGIPGEINRRRRRYPKPLF